MSHPPASAVIAEVGAALRSFEVSGVPVILGFESDEVCPDGRGQVLAPWPNRLDEGTYDFAGRHAVAPLDEPARRNAIHGLVRWSTWSVTRQETDRVTLTTEVTPQPGYPWRVSISLEYWLDSDSSLAVSALVANMTEERVPFGIGFHPYLHAGPGGVDACTLRFSATERLVVDERGLPVAWVSVEGSDHDCRRGRSLAGVELDDCFVGLGQETPEAADAASSSSQGQASDLRWTVQLYRQDGRVAGVSGSKELPYAMCYTADHIDGADRRRALAVEPMSCPPNALKSAEALVVLQPAGRQGCRWQATWRLVASSW